MRLLSQVWWWYAGISVASRAASLTLNTFGVWCMAAVLLRHVLLCSTSARTCGLATSVGDVMGRHLYLRWYGFCFRFCYLHHRLPRSAAGSNASELLL